MLLATEMLYPKGHQDKVKPEIDHTKRSCLNPSQANKQLHLSFRVSEVPCGWGYLEEEPPAKPGLFLDWSIYLLQR